MARWLTARVLSAVAVVFATVVACSALVAVFAPDEAPRPGVLAGTVEGVRLKLRGDFGVSHVEPGAVPVATLFTRGMVVDLTLLAGGLVVGAFLGVVAGRVCAARPRSALARALDGLASLALCLPVYVAGYGLLLLFAPSFGALGHVHRWLEAGAYEPLTTSPWHWFEALLVPWVLVGRRRRVLAPAARPTYGPTAAGLGTQVRVLVFNIMLVEYVFFLPGFLWFTKRAMGDDPPNWIQPDLDTLAGVAVWSSVLVVTLSLVADVLTVALDPRVSARA